MNGLAVTIIVSQLPKLFGFSTDADGFVDEVRAVRRGPRRDARGDAWSSGVGVLVGAARPAPVHPAGPGGARRGGGRHGRVGGASTWPTRACRTVGTLPQGIPRPSLPWTSLYDVGPLLVGAVGITLVSLTDTIATASSFAARRGDEVEPDQEMIGMGAANVAAGLFQGFAVSTSGSRTAVAEQSGAKSQLTGVVGAGLVVVLLLFLNGLLADLPQTALAAVVIAAALSLVDLRCAARATGGPPQRAAPLADGQPRRDPLRRPPGDRRGDRAGRAAVLPAQLVAPRRRARAGRRASTAGTTSTAFPRPSELPGIVVYRWEAPLFFANAGAFRRQVRRLARRAGLPVDRAAVRGHHRHRRHRGGDARGPRRRAERRGRSTSRSSRCAPACRSWPELRAASRPSTPSTSTRASTPRSPPSATSVEPVVHLGHLAGDVGRVVDVGVERPLDGVALGGLHVVVLGRDQHAGRACCGPRPRR